MARQTCRAQDPVSSYPVRASEPPLKTSQPPVANSLADAIPDDEVAKLRASAVATAERHNGWHAALDDDDCAYPDFDLGSLLRAVRALF